MSHSVDTELAELSPFIQFCPASRWSQRLGEPGISDFVVGNPHDGALPGATGASAPAAEAKSSDGFDCKLSEPESQRLMAKSIAGQTGVSFDANLMIDRAIPILREAIR